MNEDNWRIKAAQRDRFFNPQDNVIPGASFIIAKIMVKADLDNRTGGQ